MLAHLVWPGGAPISLSTGITTSTRRYGTTGVNQEFSAAIIEAVWRKAIVIPGIDSAVRRQDVCGAWIDRDQYGITEENGTGWEIDHLFAVIRGGSDNLGNLQPLQWQNNRAKADHVPGQWVRAVTAPAGDHLWRKSGAPTSMGSAASAKTQR